MWMLSKLFGRRDAQTAEVDPSAPDYVPSPKVKVPGAAHPQLTANAARPKARAVGVGIVFDKDGMPKITEEWLRNLTAADRENVDLHLGQRGFRVTDDFKIARV